MTESIPWPELPAMSGNRLYLDYVAGRAPATAYFPSDPLDHLGSFERRRAYPYPRAELAALLTEYNRSIGAADAALAAAASLAEPDVFCVIGGQQAELMGGPVFTTYKIVTTIRLARLLSERLGVRVVPMFWLASDDHDFDEIGHVQYLQADGEVGRVRFSWPGQGRPIADLPLTDAVLAARGELLGRLAGTLHAAEVAATYSPAPGDDYCRWHARVWARLFSHQGLVVVEPRVLRPLCGRFYAQALRSVDEAAARVAAVSARLTADGYDPQLKAEQAGRPFAFAADGRRVRAEGAAADPALAEAHPERYSADAALRPVLADSLLPVLADLLGAGEIAYHAMLAPLYDLFGVPQPLLFPRKHYTVVGPDQGQALRRYGVAIGEVLRDRLDVDAAFARLTPADHRAAFDGARGQMEASLAPLRPYIAAVDPSLDRTWEGTVSNAVRGLERLEEKALKARLAQLGYSKLELQALRNAMLPRGRLQERTLPLPHFLAHYGMGFIEALYTAGDLEEFAHEVLTLDTDLPLEDVDAQR